MNLLEVENLVKTYRDGDRSVEVLRNLNFSMQEGEFVSIRGSSGAGKSTLLNMLGALDKPTSGEIRIRSEALSSYYQNDKIHLFRRKMIGFIFQNFYLMSDFTIVENVMMPLLVSGEKKKPAKEKALSLLDKVGLLKRAEHFPSEISGGESQRVAACRAVISSPPLILADEPTGNLDSHNRKIFIDLLHQLKEEHNLTILVVTHEEALAESAEKQLIMEDGILQTYS